MPRKYVSLAIDHGTTNSCIACMDADGPRMINVEGDNPILPSAVYYDRNGVLRVGTSARSAMLLGEAGAGEGYTGYKLHIGKGQRYDFKSAGKSLTAPELGAIVIQTLLRAYEKESGEDTDACVVTIPAKFTQEAVEGTRAAAELAGLRYYPLIVEPVAAAMCYGFGAATERGEWMVFDLGGGTFDVSLVFARHGRLVVPEGGHAGDDRLGGSKFDRDLAGVVLKELGKTYRLESFTREQDRYRVEWNRLLLAVELAKIELSAKTESFVTIDDLCQDDDGKHVKVDVRVTRKEYESLILPDIERAMQICRTLLKNNRVAAEQVNRLILVGGPSKTPLIRSLLQERLRIPLEHSIDPMTAVALGAAIYADSVERPNRHRETTERGAYSLRVEAERQSTTPSYRAAFSATGEKLEGTYIEVTRADGLWKSARLPLDRSGVCTAELQLIESAKPTLSVFRTALVDESGKVLAACDEPQIRYPAIGTENRLANSLRVGIANNQTTVLIVPGDPLPAEGFSEFETTKALSKGSQGDVIRIPILEAVTNMLGSEDGLITGCLYVGTLEISSGDTRLTQDLPVGSAVEVHLRIDESRRITATAYIPILNAHFSATFKGESRPFALSSLEERLTEATSSIDAIITLNDRRPLDQVGGVLGEMEEQKLLDSLKTDLERATTGDHDAEERVAGRLVELGGTIRALQALQRRAKVELAIDALRPVVQGEDLRMLEEIQHEHRAAEDDTQLSACLASIEELENVVRGRPWREVLLDVYALSGLNGVTRLQNQLFNEASALMDRIREQGGVATVTEADIAELVAMHQKLQDAYPKLYELRQKALDELRVRTVDDMVGTDVDAVRR